MCVLYKMQTHDFKTITTELIFGFFTITGNVSLLSQVNLILQGSNRVPINRIGGFHFKIHTQMFLKVCHGECGYLNGETRNTIPICAVHISHQEKLAFFLKGATVYFPLKQGMESGGDEGQSHQYPEKSSPNPKSLTTLMAFQCLNMFYMPSARPCQCHFCVLLPHLCVSLSP